jgi:hypothetical protein
MKKRLSTLFVMLSFLIINSANAQNLPLLKGAKIQKGVKYMSPSGKHYLIFQQDGNLQVMTANNQKVWGLDQVFKNFAQIATLQLGSDANLVANNNRNGHLWSALTANANAASQLTINQNGALQLVAPGSKVLWSSDGNLISTEFIMPPGWTQYRLLKEPKIIIYGSRMATAKGLDAVAYIYSELTKRFSSKYPKNKFDDYAIYLTNGEPWAEMKKLEPVGSMWTAESGEMSGEFLLGGTSPNYLWIDEQMICKTGIRTRNEMFKAGRLKQADNSARTYDQVVHEFVHAIDFRYDLRKRVQTVYKDSNMDPVERFPWSVQNWFGTPAGNLSAGEEAFVKEIFTSSTTFSPDIYNKGIDISSIIVKPTVSPATATTSTTNNPCEASNVVKKYQASMKPGDRLVEKEALVSANGKYQLRGTTEGNFVIEEVVNNANCTYKEVYRFPLAGPINNPPKVSIFSYNPDGNVCINSKLNKGYCATNGIDNVAGVILYKSAKLELTNDGKLRLVNSTGQEIWSATSATASKSCEANEAVVKYQTSIKPGERLLEKEKMLSANGKYQLRGTTDGNFVIEEIVNSSTCTYKEVYRFPLAGPINNPPKVSIFSYNPDGNVCINSKLNKGYCATNGIDNVAGVILNKSTKLELTNDGKLRLVNNSGGGIWSAAK